MRCSMDQIFNEEELLAIANDGGSSISNFSGSEEEKSDSSRLHSPSLVPDSKSSTPNEKKGVAVSSDPSSSNKQSNNGFIPKECGKKNSGSSGSDDPSDDDYDGFLESWFEKENIAKKTKVEDDTHKDKDIETHVSTDGGRKKRENEELKVELGASVLQWISSKKSESGATAKSSANNIDAKTNYLLGEQKDVISRNSTLIIVPTENPRKRPRQGNEYTAATLEKDAPGSMSEETVRKCGKVLYASDAKRLSTPGVMVDCLARWDSRKGCYVLEMVDFVVKNLETLPPDAAHREQTACKVDAVDATATIAAGPCAKKSLHRSTELLDPRSIAKRAENQLQKLKRRKG